MKSLRTLNEITQNDNRSMDNSVQSGAGNCTQSVNLPCSNVTQRSIRIVYIYLAVIIALFMVNMNNVYALNDGSNENNGNGVYTISTYKSNHFQGAYNESDYYGEVVVNSFG